MDSSIQTILTYTIIFCIIYIWIRWRRRKLMIFVDLGIPGPPPHILFGNILELNRKGPFRCHKEWIEKYGKIVGFFHGMKPILLVAEPDLLKKILIKDFNLFSDRPESIPLRVRSFVDSIIPATSIMDNLLISLKGEKWRNVRSILSPTFSANKLKMMIPAVNQVCDKALSVLEKECQRGETIDILDMLQRLTLDIICAQAFAMDTDSVNDPKDPLLTSARIIFDLSFSSKIIFFGRCFPELGFIAMIINFLRMFIRNNGNIPPLKITNVLDEIIKQRRKDPSCRKPDLLQLLIDSSIEDTVFEKKKMDEDGNPSETSTFSRKKQVLNDWEIKANALIVLLAGYETTSSSLAYAFHFLAKYPDLQQKIQEEIDSLIEKEGHFDYYKMSNFQLTERFLLETMRFYSPTMNFICRICTENVDYGHVKIPKGMEILVPDHYIHHSEEFWEQAEEFNIDRHLPGSTTKKHPISYLAFGEGPRRCIGVRLVNITAKIIIARILQKYTVELVENHEKVKSVLRAFTMVPENVYVKLKPRT
ncbi:cytochrome P450 3A8 [Trichonephila inaurata madagascariensis]|uniref:Cytochrome P450 3A8 n=1 Tax=Trichonephila inaurata madagascariensis TaxID=2747483 RepID=A0A8X6XDG6_9ARAC|nr:cytochrome P450 3A8 [Trichonephila inaurata madagascariensis]